MSIARLALCIVGVYSMFLLWAVAQERLSVPFERIDGSGADKFKSPLVLGTVQSALSALTALLYLVLRRKAGDDLRHTLGLGAPSSPPQTARSSAPEKSGNGTANGISNGHAHKKHTEDPNLRYSTSSLLARYAQCALFITAAAPFGFAALSHISYPTMVLGKSCKLVPVMLMNVVLYRRKFAGYKYVVVTMVTAGITAFMYFGDQKKAKGGHGGRGSAASGGAYANLIGTTYLLINLAIDGATNSTQDEIFARYRVNGQQMMLWINLFSTVLTTVIAMIPLPYIPVLHEGPAGQSELDATLAFLQTHPSLLTPLFQFAITGALGQIFIFETLQHFGSLTLVTITLTRKLFTMVLSVVLYKHKLTLGQWAGAAIVFAGISVEAWVKRREVHAKRVIQEKEKAKIKTL
ncbi:UAA transporter [Punctularia strigosozonata HHB-11173 SS5]|uniref:UAA transporter n=1 Tax=Punctularia strigosozonata (strain HHB-11173) TaxID=741275 RepID=UPI0004416A04|nr:UAA transporter [Punctularia strigosozonata HHB-11173 SS5]EIN12465.1 UAA transporter [Punctularia strigosozonata HHB-11173 SS5]